MPGEAHGDVQLRARVVRVGRNAVVTTIDAHDETERIVADGGLTSAALEPAGGPPVYERPLALDTPTPPRDTPAPEEFFGIRPVDVRTVELDVVDRVRNPWGILHGGAIAMLVDAGTTDVLGGDVETTATVLHFPSPGRVGPVSARVQELGERSDGEVLRVGVHDEGGGSRLLAVAIVTAGQASREPGRRGS